MLISHSSEPLTAFARRGGNFLWHVVWVPNFETSQVVAQLSQDFNQRSYRQSFYELKSGQESQRRKGQIQAFNEGAPYFVGRDSLPHATVMHFFANPQKVKELAENLIREPLALSGERYAITGAVRHFKSVQAFLGQPEDKIQGCWVDVARDNDMLLAQDLITRRMKRLELSCITSVGDNWQPHLTLAAEPEQDGVPDTGASHRVLLEGPKEGRMVIGLSGANGQFRMIFARFDEFEKARKDDALQRSLLARIQSVANFG